MSDEKLSSIFQSGNFDPNEIYEVLETINDRDNFDKFLEWRSRFKMMDYSWRNQLLLFSQADARDLTPFFKTLKEWNKEKVGEKQGVYVKKGEIPSIIVSPVTNTYLFIPKEKYEEWEDFKIFDKNYSNYFKNKIIKSSDDDRFLKNRYETIKGKHVFLEANEYKNQKAVYEIINEVVKRGIGNKKQSYVFRKVRNQFSIDQTDYPENERAEVVKRFETKEYNPKEGERIYSELKEIAKRLGLDVVEDNESRAYSGYLSLAQGKIYILDTMPVEARVSTLAHELGHYTLQKNIENFEKKYLSDKSNYEIQAELFSKIFCSNYDILKKDVVNEDGNKVKESSGFSGKYISSYIRDLKDYIKYKQFDSLKEKYKDQKLDNKELDDKMNEDAKKMAKAMFYVDFGACLGGASLLSKTLIALEENNTEMLNRNIEQLKEYQGTDIEWNSKKECWFIKKGLQKDMPLTNFNVDEEKGETTNTEKEISEEEQG